MNETKTKTVIETWPVREYEAVKVWRETTAEQCRDELELDGMFCAIGVLGGYDRAEAEYGIGWYPDNEMRGCPRCNDEALDAQEMIWHWNDAHEFTFKEIADLAEAYPHLVFTEAQS